MPAIHSRPRRGARPPTAYGGDRVIAPRSRRRSRHSRIVEAPLLRRATPRRSSANSDTVAVVTGQQAGVFGGPLFTILKAITAIQLARRAARELGAPVVPVFWVDAEDHDWNEIASCTILDAAAAAAHDHAGRRPRVPANVRWRR